MSYDNELEIKRLQCVLDDLEERIQTKSDVISVLEHRLYQYSYLTLEEQQRLNELSEEVKQLNKNYDEVQETLMMLKGGVL